MSNERFKLLLAGVAVLAAVVLVISGIKIQGSGLIASIIDVITDTTLVEPAPTELIPTEPTPTPADSTSTEPVPALLEPATTTPTGTANFFTEILQTATEFVKDFLKPAPALIAPKGISNFKIFVLAQDALESAVNEWFSIQKNIVVDQLNVQDYGGGGYLVVISYHTGGTGNSSTRLKLITGENSEADANAFLSSLGPSQTVRSVTAVAGSYSGSQTTVTIPIIFIVYE